MKNELHLFAGGGGGILGGMLLGNRCACAVEIDDYARRILLQRQRDGILPWFPIWDDVTTFDARPWRGIINLVAGGFPCQDISAAGLGEGLEGKRSGLWTEMARVIREVQPQHVLIENSPLLTACRSTPGWLVQVVDLLTGTERDRREITLRKRPDVLCVLEDLSEMGYDAEWGVVGAHHAGAPHYRDRIWILGTLADSQRKGLERQRDNTGQSEISESRNSRPCFACGYRFDHEWLGVYGCPNCEGEGLVGNDSDSPSRRRKLCRTGNIGRKPATPPRERTEEPRRIRSDDRTADAPDATSIGRETRRLHEREESKISLPGVGIENEPRRHFGPSAEWWAAEPGVGRVADGLANRVDRLRATGNGQVPAVVELAWQILHPDSPSLSTDPTNSTGYDDTSNPVES